MLKTIIFTALLTIMPSASAPQEADRLHDLVESICIGGHLNEELLGPMVASASSFLKMKTKQMPLELLRQGNRDATSGWGLYDDDEQFIIMFAKKHASTHTTRGTKVTIDRADCCHSIRNLLVPISETGGREPHHATFLPTAGKDRAESAFQRSLRLTLNSYQTRIVDAFFTLSTAAEE